MVQVRKAQGRNHDGSVDVEQWVEQLDSADGDKARLLSACHIARDAESRLRGGADDEWAERESPFLTGLEMAEVLADLKLDQDTLLAAILYRVVRERKLPLRQVREHFGADVARLINGVLQMAAISRALAPADQMVLGQGQAQIDNIRRMLVTLIDDVRVALIKLSERSCALRAVKTQTPERQRRVAHEVFHIYAPLAHRLGIGHIKWELEDLAFRYLHPENYKKIAKLLDERRLTREDYIESVIADLKQALAGEGIQSEIDGRAKHIYSIWRKMQRKNIGFSEVYDIRAVRILVGRVQDCYATLGLVHALWPNIPNEFDDYIASPKENGYQSLHTAVFGPEGKVLEVQIRTKAMHQEAEFGVCAHWQYKGADSDRGSVDAYERKITWLRQVLDWHEEVGEQADFAGELGAELAQERIYVFTPDGHVVDLPNAATPVDFAYHIHTEVGHRCRGAKVNGRIVPLTYNLSTGEQVEILTGKDARPSRDWLRSDLGYVSSSRTRSKIQHWYRLQAREENLEQGRAMLEKEFKRLDLTLVDYKALASSFNFLSVEDMYVGVGASDLGSTQVVRAAQRLVDGARDRQLDFDMPEPQRRQSVDPGVRVRGVGRLLTALAGCCNPVPGDGIVGFVTVGRGVTIHRNDCKKLLQLTENEPQRIIEVDWGDRADASYPATILVEAFDRPGLLRDITTVLANEKANVLASSTRSDTENNTATMQMTLQVAGLDALSALLGRINQLPNVINAVRTKDS